MWSRRLMVSESHEGLKLDGRQSSDLVVRFSDSVVAEAELTVSSLEFSEQR